MTDRRRCPPVVLPLIERRIHARLTPERRHAEPVRCGYCLPAVAAFIALAGWLWAPAPDAFDGPHYVIERPSCTEYAANVPADTGISEWCVRKRGY